MNELEKGKLTLYYNYNQGVENIINKDDYKEKNDIQLGQFNLSIEKESTINKYEPKEEIKLPFDTKDLSETIEKGYNTFNQQAITFANIYGSTAGYQNKGNEEKKAQLIYFQSLFKFIDDEKLGTYISNSDKKKSKTIEQINSIVNLRRFFELYSTEKDSEECTTLLNEIKKEWNVIYKDVAVKFIKPKPKEELLEIINNQKTSETKISIESIIEYEFFQNNKKSTKFISITLDLENYHFNGYTEFLQKIKSEFSALEHKMNFARYFEYLNQKDDNSLSDIEFKKLLGLYSNNRYSQDDYIPKTYQNPNFDFFISEKDNIVIENKKSTGWNQKSVWKIEEFALAIAYKNMYINELDSLLQQDISSNNYSILINLASKFAQFQAKYNFKNPTKLKAYNAFYECLNIGMYQEEIESKLDGIIKFIGLEHDKLEADRFKLEISKRSKIVEIKEKFNEEILIFKDDIGDVDNDKDTKWSIIIGTIATIFTVTGGVAGGVEAYTKHIEVLIFSILVIGFGIFYGIWKINKNSKDKRDELKESIVKLEKEQLALLKTIESYDNEKSVKEFEVKIPKNVNEERKKTWFDKFMSALSNLWRSNS